MKEEAKMESFHAVEAQMWRWRRRADGLYAVLLNMLEGTDIHLLENEEVNIIEQYCLDRYDDEAHWRLELLFREHKGANT